MADVPRLRIAVGGLTGRMGRLIAARTAAADFTLVGGTASSAREVELPDVGRTRLVAADAAADLVADADVFLDVSTPDALAAVLRSARDALDGRALVVGTTGLSDDVAGALDDVAQRAAVLVAANFSVGVNLLAGLVERAAALLARGRFDAEIVEIHHGRKTDAPSGTALALARALARGRDEKLEDVRRDGRSGNVGARPQGEIGLHAVRGGGVVGEHRVLFLGESERIELAHAAHDRGLFADGALVAARWLAGRPPGRYTMTDVLGL